MSAQTPIRFGILGCAEIARKVSRAISVAQNATLYAVGSRSISRAISVAQNATLYAVGSRSIDKATAFAKANNFPANAKIYGSYDAVLDDPDVDAVYVPLPQASTSSGPSWRPRRRSTSCSRSPWRSTWRSLTRLPRRANPVGCRSWTVQCGCTTRGLRRCRNFSPTRTVLIHTVFTFASDPDFLKNDIRVNPDLDAHGALGIQGGTFDDGDNCCRYKGEEACFSFASETGFDEFVTSWVPPPSQHIVTTDLPQEVLMVREFSRLVGTIKNGSNLRRSGQPLVGRHRLYLMLSRHQLT
ncbi:Oxidoreductase family protein, partial [Prunus dulcis]